MCHSSPTITSCCSMIMHDPMLQGSVHNFWKLKTSQFLHGQHTYPDMSPIEHVWDALDRRIRQRVPVPANIQQLRTAIEAEWTSIPQATINNLINSIRVAFYCGQPKAHLCNNHANNREVDGLSRQRRSAPYAFIILFIIINNN